MDVKLYRLDNRIESLWHTYKLVHMFSDYPIEWKLTVDYLVSLAELLQKDNEKQVLETFFLGLEIKFSPCSPGIQGLMKFYPIIHTNENDSVLPESLNIF